MKNILLNDDFMDFVNSQMNENYYILNKIENYQKYNRFYSNVNDIIENKIQNTEDKKIIEKIIDCVDNISRYENSFAYYLGMRQALTMTQLEEK